MGLINPRVDIAFKKIFGVEENKDLLMSLLNSIVSDEDQIDEVELLNPYNDRNFKKDKLSVLDIKARNKQIIPCPIFNLYEENKAIEVRSVQLVNDRRRDRSLTKYK
jgi:hypothetical protein